MNILIDNKDLKTTYNIEVLDYTGALSFPAEREDERVWQDKSGVDKNLANIRYEAKEFVFSCCVRASNEALAYSYVNTLVEYMMSKGVFVLSLRDTALGIRECFLCQRSGTIVSEINIRQQNSLYVFKLGFKDVNPNALVFKTTVALLSASVAYTKGQTTNIYWGNGDRGVVSNSATYSHTYAANGPVDIIVDVDKNASTVTTLNANFTADITAGAKPLSVQFTSTSTGTITIYSWDFGDGSTSDEQNPLHIFTESGIFTVTLQVFNGVGGYDSEVKTAYVNVRNSYILFNSTDAILINSTDQLLKN